MACFELFGVLTVAFEYTEHKLKIFGSFDEKKPLHCLLNEWVWLSGCGYSGRTNSIWLPTKSS